MAKFKKGDYIMLDDGDVGFIFMIEGDYLFITSNTTKHYRQVHKDDANRTTKEVADIIESV